MTQPIFCVSSGRAGSYLIHKILSLYPEVESHHEYCIEHTQKLSVLYRAGIVGLLGAEERLAQTHEAGVWYSQAQYFADSSNKLSYLIKPLTQLFPQPRFIHLVRDGRRVVSSFYHKLSDECYTDFWVKRLSNALDSGLFPPPIKAAWWPCPTDPDHPFFTEWDRWQRLCWFWQDVNGAILEGLEGVPDDQKIVIRLESLTQSYRELVQLIRFVGVSGSSELIVKAWQLCQTPQNVNQPESHPLTPEQERQYFEIAGVMHERLGYGNSSDYMIQYQKR